MDMSGIVYIAKAGDTFDGIALEAFGNEKYAADLLCANPSMSEKMILDGGEEILFPVVDLTEDEINAEDSEGYTLANAPWKE